MSAMNAAPRSSRVVTNRIEESASASMTWRFSSPGRPNTYSTPSFSRHATRSCATFRSCCDDMRGSLPLPGTRSRDSVRRDGGSTGPPRHPQTVRAARGRVVALDRRRRRGRPRRDRRRPQHPGSRRRGAAYLIVRGHGDRAVGGRDRDRGVRGARSGNDMARRDRARRRLRGDRDREVRHGAHRLVSGEPQRTDPERRWSDLGRHGRTDRGGRRGAVHRGDLDLRRDVPAGGAAGRAERHGPRRTDRTRDRRDDRYEHRHVSRRGPVRRVRDHRTRGGRDRARAVRGRLPCRGRVPRNRRAIEGPGTGVDVYQRPVGGDRVPGRVPGALDRVPAGNRGDLAVQVGDTQMTRRLRLLRLMVRPRAAITMGTFLVFGLARHAGPTISVDLVWATVALAASYAVATSVNDLADVEIDRTNGLRDASRPLATGAASVGDLRWTAATAGVVAVAATIPLGAPGLAVIGLCLAVDVAYSAAPARLSRRWTLAPIALTVAYVALPYALGIVVAHATWGRADAPLVAGLCILFFARIILKDVRDRLGDAAHGKPTMLLRLGKNATYAVSIAAATMGIATIVWAIRPPAPIVAAIAVDGVAIVWMLTRLRVTTDGTAELVTIGTAARAGNALLIAVVAWLLLSAQGAPPAQASLLVAILTAVAAVGFLDLALRPGRARVAYKA